MSFVRIPPTTIADILKRIAAGEIRADIARRCGVSEYSITQIAKRHGVEVAKCAPGANWGKANRSHISGTPVADPALEWRRKAWASRRFGGSGYLT